MAMSSSERDRRRREKRKAKGLCVNCRNDAAKGHTLCESCLEDLRRRNRERTDFLKERGFCTVCGRVKVFGDEITCPECRAKYPRRTLSEKAKEHMRSYQRERYHKLKEQGLCVKCGKRKSEFRKTKCRLCAEKDKESQVRLKSGLKRP